MPALRRAPGCLFLVLQMEIGKSHRCAGWFILLFLSFLKLIENPHPSVLKSCLPVLPISQLRTQVYPSHCLFPSAISSPVAYLLLAMNPLLVLTFSQIQHSQLSAIRHSQCTQPQRENIGQDPFRSDAHFGSAVPCLPVNLKMCSHEHLANF